MSEPAVIQENFNGGEISPRLFGRSGLRQWDSAVAAMRNYIATVQGGANKRPPTRYAANSKVPSNRVRLIPFIFSRTQGYVCEQGAGYCRFFTNNVRLETAGTPVEISTPWTLADLDTLSWVQSNDVQYQAVKGRAPQVLNRTGAAAFNMAALTLTGGPLKDQNIDKSITVTATAGTGSITITASSGIFQAGHVGGLFEIEAVDFSAIPAWEPGIEVAVNDKRRSDGKVYQADALPASASKRTGTIQPTHTSGSERDGMSSGQDINAKGAGGVLWRFLYLKAGLVRITGFTSATQVTATVINTLPDTVVSSGSWRWSHGAFSDAEGWPQAVAIWNQRLILAKNNQIFGGVVGDYPNFAAKTDGGLLTADMAFRFTLNSPSAVVWMVGDRDLLVGTESAEYLVRAANRQAAASSSNLEAPLQSGYGSAQIQAVVAGSEVLFITPSARRARATGYDYASDRYNAKDLNVLAPHVLVGGIKAVAYQAEPDAILWAARGDGRLLSLTYYAEQDVQGWAVHQLGGRSDAAGTPAKVESLCVIPSPDGSVDQLWLSVQRYIGGAVVRHVEWLLPVSDDATLQTDLGYADCSLTYSGAPTNYVGNATHLARETATVIAGGAKHPDVMVSGAGGVSLNGQFSVVHVGLGYDAYIDTLKLKASPDAQGTVQGRLKRIVKVGLRLLNTLGMSVGRPAGVLDQIELTEDYVPNDAGPVWFTGDRLVGLPAGFDREGTIRISSERGLPSHVLAVLAEVEMGR